MRDGAATEVAASSRNLTQTLQATLATMAEHLGTLPETDEPEPAESPGEATGDLLLRLNDCLVNFDAAATDIYRKARRLGLITGSKENLDELQKHIDRYDFAEAKLLLDELTGRNR